MPTVTNTDAGVSGKTLLIAESSQTVSGLHTYDRGTSAPFAVVAGAAAVANLDADKLDGQEGAYYRDASNLNAGTVPAARLGSGTPTVDTVLRGDNTWGDGGIDIFQIEALT